MIPHLDPKLEPLLAGYIRGVEGSAEVLGDALLERGFDPLPIIDDAGKRLERALTLLAAARQSELGCLNVRRMIDRFTNELATNKPLLLDALAALEETATIPNAAPMSPDVRHGAFRAWRACDRQKTSLGATRAAWAVWMLLRDMPLDALRTLRAIDDAELKAQIDLVARTLGG